MQKLLVDVLQKSGYTSLKEEVGPNSPQNDLINSQSQQLDSGLNGVHSSSRRFGDAKSSYLLKKTKNKKNLNEYDSNGDRKPFNYSFKETKSRFLESNAFDNCYFKKL